MKVTFVSNIPSPYRTKFYNELSKYVDVNVMYEAKMYSKRQFSFDDNSNSFSERYYAEDLGSELNKRINLRLIKDIIRCKADLLIISNYTNFSIMIAIMILKIIHKPFCLNIDGGIIKSNESIFSKAVKKFFISAASHYFSPSKNSDDYLIYYGADRNKIFRYPFTSISMEQLFLPTYEQKLKVRKSLDIFSKYHVVSVGQLINRKGFDLLIKNWPKDRLDIVLTIIGSGDEKDSLLKYIELQGIQNIRIIDFMESDSLEKYYESADAFVLLTREDIWGLVVNEAMAKGLPVITTTKCVAGLELINKKNGCLIDLSSNFNLEEILESAFKVSKSDVIEKIKPYTIENMAVVMYKLFFNILEEKR